MAKERNVGEGMTVNDGRGFLDNEGMVDSLIVDCNNAVKELMSGQYIAFCDLMVQMVRKMANLKKGIISDLKSRDEQIEELQKLLNSGLNVKKDGESNA